MNNLLNLVFNYGFIRSKNIKLRQGLIERRLKEKYVSDEKPKSMGVWKLQYDTDDVFRILDYKDENWEYVNKLNKFFVLHSFGLFKGDKVSYTPIGNNQKQVTKSDRGSYLIKSKGISREWLYMTTYGQQYDNVKVEVEIIFNTLFKEFQLAFCHKSLFERLRFRIVDGNNLVFEVVTKGFFSSPIFQKHFQLQIGVRYKFDVTCLNGVYTFSEGGKELMVVRDKKYQNETGNVGVIFWDDKPVSSINAEIFSCKIYTL